MPAVTGPPSAVGFPFSFPEAACHRELALFLKQNLTKSPTGKAHPNMNMGRAEPCLWLVGGILAGKVFIISKCLAWHHCCLYFLRPINWEDEASCLFNSCQLSYHGKETSSITLMYSSLLLHCLTQSPARTSCLASILLGLRLLLHLACHTSSQSLGGGPWVVPPASTPISTFMWICVT